MTERKERKPDDLDGVIDALMEDIPIERAYRVRDTVRRVDKNLWKPALAIILAFAMIMLLLCGLLVTGDYFGFSEKPTNWEQVGVICLFTPMGVLMGYVLCHEMIFDKIKTRLRRLLDDALEDFVKEKSTKTGNKPN